MSAVNRRLFLGVGGAMFGSMAIGAEFEPARANLVVGDAVLNDIPADFNGFSVEKSQLADTSFYTADNQSLVALHRRLSPRGVLRIGGNTSEFCWWKATPDAIEPTIKAIGIGRADNWMPQHHVGITPKAVENLRGFLDACGWTCIWGLNFGTGTPERNAEEAAVVARILGPRLRNFQIGNEPDLYVTPDNLLRPAGWGFSNYVSEWVAIADAVSARVPEARFAGPDVSNRIEWIPEFAVEAQKRLGNRLVAISAHYYVGGPPSSPDMTIPHLLQRDPKVAAAMDIVAPAMRDTGLPFRMTEANSCYRGGKPGMSNTLAAALWGADYALYLASRGCTGLHFHGGPGAQIARSIGDKMPGARSSEEMEYAKRGSFYSPFAGTSGADFEARPLFYGMMLVEQFAGTKLLANRFDAGGINATAFAAKTADGLKIAVINKDGTRDLAVTVRAGTTTPSPTAVWRLAGSKLSSTTGITFAGSEVTSGSAEWSPSADRHALRQDGAILVPRASAVLVKMS